MKKTSVLTLPAFLVLLSLAPLSSSAQEYLWGMTRSGGDNNLGVPYRISTSGTNFITYGSFNGGNGSTPGDGAGFTQIAYGNGMIGITEGGGPINSGAAFEIALNGSAPGVYPDIRFSTAAGSSPTGKVTLGHDNQYNAMTSSGDTHGYGGIMGFKFGLVGSPRVPGYIMEALGAFDGSNGRSPKGSLTLGASGKMYGMTEFGGASDKGVIFAFNRIAGNIITKLIDFGGTANGANPTGSLIVASDGKLYGMTKAGGAHNLGVIFSVNQDGSAFTTLYDFDATTSGGNPKGSLVEFTDGKLYGMTSMGGASTFGTIFSITTDGTFTKIIDFDGANGKSPVGDLTVSPTGDVMYGTAYSGGENDKGTLFKLTGGTDFQKLFDFTSAGSNPVGSLTMSRQTQTISITPVTIKYKMDEPFPLEVETSSGLPPSFAVSNSNISIENKTVTINLDEVTKDISGLATTIVPYQRGNYKYLPAYAASGALGLPPSITMYMVRMPQKITVQPISDKKFGDSPFTIESTASSGLPVTITSYSQISIDGNIATITSAGLSTLKFSQEGNNLYEPAEEIGVQVGIRKGDQTITFDPPTKKTCCDPFNVGANAKTQVVFSSESPDVAGAESNGTIWPNRSGTLRVSAYARESNNYHPARITKEIVIEKGKPTLFVASSSISAKFKDQPIQLVSSTHPEAPIISSSDTPGVAVVDWYGRVNFIGIGTTEITLTQPATETSEAATPRTVNVTVNAPDVPGTGNVISWPYFGDYFMATQAPINIIASASSGLPVKFTSSNSNVIDMDGNLMKFKGPGTAKITASQPGKNGIPAATPIEKTFIVDKGSQTVTLAYLSSITISDLPLYLPKVTDQGLPLTYTSSNPAKADVQDYKLVVYAQGDVTITATQAGNPMYYPLSRSQSYWVYLSSPSIFFERIQPKTYGDAPFDLTASANAGIEVLFTSSDPSVISISGNKATILKAGTSTITASTIAQDGYDRGASGQTVVVAKKSQAITFNAIAGKKFSDPNFILSAPATSGLPVAFKTTTPGILKIDGKAVQITGSGTATLIATQAGNENYLKADSVVHTFKIDDSGHLFSLFMSGSGAPNGSGSVFTLDSEGNNMQFLKGFESSEEIRLTGGFVKGMNGKLYMNSILGGVTNAGSIVRIDADGSNFTRVASYNLGTTGANPNGTPIIGSDGYLYSTQTASSNVGGGSIMRAKLDGSELTMIYNFKISDGYKPSAGLLQGSNGRLYGMTDLGGFNSAGVIYSVNTDGSDYRILRDQKSNNVTSYVVYSRALVEGSDGKIYGSVFNDGDTDVGMVFKMNKDGSEFKAIVDFDVSTNSALPAEIMIGSDGKIYGTTLSGGANNLGIIFSVETDGTQFTKLIDMEGGGLSLAASPLIEGSDGLLYGTSGIGGSNNAGAIFKIDKNGSGFEVIHSFDVTSNAFLARGPLFESSPGIFYGGTSSGGTSNLGVIYRITSSGDYTVLKNFANTESMSSGIGFDPNENYLGISTDATASIPSFFKLNADNSEYQKFHTWPANRDIYGSPLNVSTGHVWTYVIQGGSQFIVRTNTDGTESTDIFSNSNATQTGARVESWLEHDGYVYALTSTGGANGKGTFFKMSVDGTGFTKLTDLPSNRPDFPIYLRIGFDGVFYAMSSTPNGSVFISLTKEGVYKKIRSFTRSEVGEIKDMLDMTNGEFAILNNTAGSSDSAPASIFTMSKDGIKTGDIYKFNKDLGTSPVSFMRTMDGWLYVLTEFGGTTGDGGVFKIRADGSGYKKIIDNNKEQGFDITSMFFKREAQTLALDPIAAKKVRDGAFVPVYVSSSGAKPALTSSDPSVVIIENGIVKIVGEGTVVITAVLPESKNFYRSNSVEREFTVTRDVQSIAFTNPGARPFEDGSFTIDASATSELPVILTVLRGNVTISDSQITISQPGIVIIMASQPGDERWNAAEPVTVSFCINPPIPSITVSQAFGTVLTTTSQPTFGYQWYLNGVSLQTGTTSQIIAEESGSYIVSSAIDGCESESASVDVVVTGLKDELSDLIDVYPNPVTNELNVAYHGADGSLELRLMSCTGQLLDFRPVTGGSTDVLSVKDYPAGIYILRMECKTGVEYRKIVKE